MEEARIRYIEQPASADFKVVAGGEYSHDHVAHACGPFFEAAQACDQCINPSFTKIWLRRLLDTATRRKAHRCLQDLMTIVRFTSVVSEHKHLIGQQCKPKK